MGAQLLVARPKPVAAQRPHVASIIDGAVTFGQTGDAVVL
jgi:hypothetical protein